MRSGLCRIGFWGVLVALLASAPVARPPHFKAPVGLDAAVFYSTCRDLVPFSPPLFTDRSPWWTALFQSAQPDSLAGEHGRGVVCEGSCTYTLLLRHRDSILRISRRPGCIETSILTGFGDGDPIDSLLIGSDSVRIRGRPLRVIKVPFLHVEMPVPVRLDSGAIRRVDSVFSAYRKRRPPRKE